MFVSGEVVVEQAGVRSWVLRAPVVYRGHSDTFTVPAGFRTDFASVPRVFVWLLPSYGQYTRPAVLHDYLVRGQVTSRVDADGLFRRSMRELHVSFLRRWLMWAAVRVVGLPREPTTEALGPLLVAAPLALVFVAIPGTVVQLFIVVFWVLELVVWAVRRLFGNDERRPGLDMRM